MLVDVKHRQLKYLTIRVAPDTNLAGYPAIFLPDNQNPAGYLTKYAIKNKFLLEFRASNYQIQ